MNREELYNAVTEVKDEHLKRADARHEKKRQTGRRRWRGAVAAVLVIALLGGVLLRPDRSVLVTSAYALELAEYPEMAKNPGLGGDWETWWEDCKAQRGPAGYADDLDDFYSAVIRQFLSGAGEKNVVCSPLNLYMAFAMLAEVTDGESRQQVLDLLNKSDLPALRTQASILWNANYRDDGATTSLLASSLWLDEDLSYKENTVKTLADTYYASSYQGQMGSEEYDQALRDWLNEQTGGLLEEQAAQLRMEPTTVLALATTVYFNARWRHEFNPNRNTTEVFHTLSGDVETEFMNSTLECAYYWGERFAAVPVYLEDAGAMWLVLPDEGVGVDDLLADGEAMSFLTDRSEWENSKYLIVNLSMPKFDVASQLDLIDGMKKLGVTDVFDYTVADFTAVTDTEDVCLSKVQHDARVIVDEEGVEAAAYTVMMAETGAAMPPNEEVDFVLDRPFLFLMTGVGSQPLFVGVVNQP